MATFKGQVAAVSPIQSGTSKSGKAWRKVDVVLVYDNSKPEYPKAIVFSVMNDNVEKFGLVQGGEYEVEVDFSVREYNGRHYMSASCWKATRLDAQQPASTAYPTNPYAAPVVQPQQQTSTKSQQSDDLPF